MPSELATQTVAGLSAGTRQQAVGGSGLQHLLCNRKRRPNSAGCTRACSWLRLASQHPTCSEPFETITEFTRSANNHTVGRSLPPIPRFFRQVAGANVGPRASKFRCSYQLAAAASSTDSKGAKWMYLLGDLTADSVLTLSLAPLSPRSTRAASNHQLGQRSSPTRKALGIASHRHASCWSCTPWQWPCSWHWQASWPLSRVNGMICSTISPAPGARVAAQYALAP